MADNKVSLIISVDAGRSNEAVDKLNASLAGMNATVEKTNFSKTKDGLISISSQLDTVRNQLTGLTAAWAGIEFVLKPVTERITQIIDRADEMNDLSQKIGIGVRELGKYELATKQSGVGMETLAKGIKGLASSMLEHGDALKEAGINAKDADGAMQQLADLFRDMPDGIQKTALATKLFGKTGMDLIPMLNLGSKGLAESAEKSARYAAELEKLAPVADKFNDTMAELSTNSKTVGMSIANDFLPSVSALAQQMAKAQLNGAGFLASLQAGLKTTNLSSKSLDEIRERAASLQGTISDLTSRGKNMEGNGLDPIFGGKLKASIAELKILQTEIAERLKQMRGFQSSVRAVDNAILDAEAKIGKASKTGADLYNALGGDGTAEALSEDERAFNSTLEAAKRYRAELDATIVKGTALTQAEKALADAKMQLAPALFKEIEAYLQSNVAREKTVALNAAARKATEDWAESARKATEEEYKRIDALGRSAQAIEDEVAAWGKGKSAIEEETIARLENTLAVEAWMGADEKTINLLTREIEARKRLASALANKEALEASDKAAKQAADEWIKGWEETDKIARQAFTDWAENGKSMADSIGEALKKALLSAIYEATLKPVAFQIYSSIAGGGVGGKAGDLAASAGGSFLGSTMLAGSSIADIGSAFMAGMQSTWAAPGSVAAIGAGQGASVAFTAGAALPYVGAAVGALKLMGAFDRGGPKVGGDVTFTNGKISDWNSGWGFFTETQTNAAMTTAMQTFSKGLEETIAKFGGNTKGYAYSFGASSDPKGTAPDRVAAQLLNASGQAVFQQSREVARGTGEKELAVEMDRLMLAALKEVNLPAWAQAIVAPLDTASASAEQMTVAFNALNTAMDAINTATAARDQLLYALMNDAEKLDAAKKSLADAGLSETVQGWKDQINSLDLTKVVDQQTLATMANLKGAFDLVQQAAQQTAATATDTATALRSASDIARERAGLQEQLDNLTLSNTELLQKQRNALDETNRAMFDQVQAATPAANVAAERKGLQEQLDSLTLSNTELLARQRAALDESNRALFDQVQAATRAATVASERKTLQEQLDGLTLTNTQLLEKQRNALDETNRALFDQIQTATRAAAVANERKGLQEQLDGLTLTNAQSLQKQRAALDESNRALFDQIQAINAAQQAVDAASKDMEDAFAGVQRAVNAERKKADESFATVQQALDDSAKAMSDALATVERSVASERQALDDTYNSAAKAAQTGIDAITKSVQKLTGLSQSLRGTLDNLKLPGTEAQARRSAQAQISAALAVARAGSGLPETDAIKQALTVLSQPSQSLFKTFTDYKLDFVRTSNDINALNDIASSQLSQQEDNLDVSERQLQILNKTHDDEVARLDGILTKAQRQVDAANGVNTSVLAVNDAVKKLDTTVANFLAARDQYNLLKTIHDDEIARLDGILTKAQGQIDAANHVNNSVLSVAVAVSNLDGAVRALAQARNTAAGTVAVAAPVEQTATIQAVDINSIGGAAQMVTRTVDAVGQYVASTYQTILGRTVDDSGLAYWSQQIKDGTVAVADFVTQLTAVAKDYLSDLTRAANYVATFGSLPTFAVGTTSVPADMVAQIHKDERIMPAADNRELMARLRSPQENNAVLVAEVRALRAEVANLREANSAENRAIAGHTSKTATATRALTNIVTGGDGGDAINVRTVT